MTTGVTTRLQRKSRNTSRSSATSSSAAASAAESQTTTSNSISTTARMSVTSSVPLPTVTVTVNSSLQGQETAKDEVDPLCIRSMSETASSSPAPSGSARRASSTGNQSIEPNTFSSAKIKTDPDGDVVMKTEGEGNNWSSYPLNGLNMKHEIKEEKQEEKSGSDDVSMKDAKDDKKIEIKKESEDKENEDGKQVD